MSALPRNPAQPPALVPSDPRYYDARDLEAELRRTFQVCHECRMCVGYCGSFPELFARIDRDIASGKAEGAEALDDADIRKVSDLCWQCKLCFVKCPYTVDDGASELLDFPRLMAREKAARAQRDGIPLVDRLLGEPQALGAAAAGPGAPVANLISAQRLLRKVQEKVTGISADFPIPPFASETFSSWFAKRTPTAAETSAPAMELSANPAPVDEVVLFATCYGEYNVPSVPRAATLVLEHHGIRVHALASSEESLTCCGMPNLDGGDVAAFKAKVEHNVARLLPYVRRGLKVLVPGPTCGYTMKKEWSAYVETEEAREVAAASLDLMEYFVQLARAKKLKRTFREGFEGFGDVAYHAACHLRAQKIGFPGARLLGLLPSTEVHVLEECSAVDGTWGMKAEHYDQGRRYAQKLVRAVNDTEPGLVVSDCTLAGLRMGQENQAHVLHPIEALALAYGLDVGVHGVSAAQHRGVAGPSPRP